MKDLTTFTNSYPVSKTLRFKLIPKGDTLKHIEEKGFLTEDEKRAESYKEMKKTIDEYHKWFIEKAMDKVVLTDLPTYYELYTAPFDEKKTDEWKKAFDVCKKNLRKEVVAGFSNAEVKDIYSKLYKKELFKELLPAWKESVNPEAYLDDSFNKFTTYFTGFHENRRNMYSEEEKSTAISYRLINENLPKHIDNIKVFQSVAKTEIADNFEEIYSTFEPYLNVTKLEDVFTLNNYNELLTQTQIDAYNLLIGGKAEKGKQKIKGLNEYINLYNQHNKDQHLPKLKKLYKQILSDREKLSFLPESFDDLNELTASVDAFYNENLRNNEGIDVLTEWKLLLNKLPSYDLQHIYLKNDRALTDISQSIFGNYAVVGDAINHYEETFGTVSKKKASGKKRPDYYSLSFLEMVLEQYVHYIDDGQHQDIVDAYTDKCIASSFTGLEIFGQIEAAYGKISDISKISYAESEKLKDNDKNALKEFLDLVLELQHTVKPLFVDSGEFSDKDLNFYSTFESLYSALDLIIPLYNKVRNYMTKKPYSTEKIKLNFNSPTLLDGWDLNKETSNLSIILRKDGLYYLGIIDKADTKAIEKLSASDAEDCYEKMEYKLLSVPFMTLPKGFFAKSNIDEFQPSDEILSIRERGSFKKGNNFSKEDCHKFIDFYKDSIDKHKDWKNFGFEFSDTDSYEDISQFYKQVELQGYKMSFKKLAVTDIDRLVADGKLYLFQIYNKDFSEHSHGKPNLHTMYWKALFDEKNLQDVVYKLNGKAEMFYRKASIKPEDATVHPANQPIAHKNPNNKDTESLFVYDITKDKRYTADQFQFHVSITMNFKAAGDTRINQKVREYIKNNADVNIIGIDRGERNLLYISVIDQKGNVLRDADGKAIQYSLNDIDSCSTQNGKTVKTVTPYHKLLDDREKKRAKSRENWDTIEGIKELKEGYISQVVSLITHLMVEYNAIVVMEDLNFGFKRGRFKVEKQVYQKFEKMLIDKLNYLVFKDTDEDSPAGLYNALQLTDRFTSFRDMGKQSGFIFYVPAWNTSKIDPVTGFVNLFPRPKTVGEKKAFFSKFENIYYDGENFCFQFDYSDFTQKAKTSRTKWTLSTQGGDRLYWNSKVNNGKGKDESINLTQSIKDLLDKNDISYSNGENLTERISALPGSELGNMYFYLSVLLKMRYSSKETGDDFILSPVADKNGSFYDSRKCDDALPKDADANGAYNIARKGLWVIEQINNSDDVMKASLAISNEDWLRYIQK